MKTFRMADVEKIEAMLAAGKTVEVEWKDGATGEMDLCQYFRQKKSKGYAAFLSSSSSFCWGVI